MCGTACTLYTHKHVVGKTAITEAARSPDLSHLGVDVETGVAKLGDLLGQKLHSLRRVAEDYGLIDLELKEDKCIQDSV